MGKNLEKKKEKLQNPIYQQLLLNEQQILMYSRQINNLEYQNRLKLKGLTNVDMDIIRRNNQKTLKIKPLKEDLIECLPIKKANEKDCIQCIICTEKIKLNVNIIISWNLYKRMVK